MTKKDARGESGVATPLGSRKFEKWLHIVFVHVEGAERRKVVSAGLAFRIEIGSRTPGKLGSAYFHRDCVGHHACVAAVFRWGKGEFSKRAGDESESGIRRQEMSSERASIACCQAFGESAGQSRMGHGRY
jgi:hypothetical protein